MRTATFCSRNNMQQRYYISTCRTGSRSTSSQSTPAALEGVLQGKLQNPHVSRGADLAEELVVQGRKICRRNGQPRRHVRPEAVGHVISLDAKLHPLLFPD